MAGSGVTQMREDDDIVLSVKNLVMEFKVGRDEIVHAVSDVSFDAKKGETLGIVGESGYFPRPHLFPQSAKNSPRSSKRRTRYLA